MVRPWLAAFVFALATALGPVAWGVAGAAPPPPDDAGREAGWAPAPHGWVDPGPRGRPVSGGDGPRLGTRRIVRLLRWRPFRKGHRPSSTRWPPRRPKLSRLGRRQSDGG